MSSKTYAAFNDYIIMLEILKTTWYMFCIFFLNLFYFRKKFSSKQKLENQHTRLYYVYNILKLNFLLEIHNK